MGNTRFQRLSTHSTITPMALAISTLALATPVSAQVALEEVLVTAERRTESVQEVPIAITAFTESQIADLGIIDLGDLTQYTPNVNFGAVAGDQGQLAAFIRGVGTAEPSVINDPKVGTYVDGIYISKVAGGLFDLVATERVEILRGPQGTLFGRNTTGGAISITTKRPTGELAINAQATVGNYGTQRYRFMADLPKVANISAQVSASYNDTDGWADNHYTGPAYIVDTVQRDLGSEENMAYRLALRWEPTDNFTIDYDFMHSELDSVQVPSQIIAVHTTTNNGFTIVPTPYTYLGGELYQQMAANASLNDRQEDYNLDGVGLNQVDVDTHTVIAQWDISENITLKYLFSDRDMEGSDTGTELDGGAYMARDLFYGDFAGAQGPVATSPFWAATNYETIEAQTHELQIIGSAMNDRLFYTGGVFFLDEETYQDNPQTPALPIEFLLVNPASAALIPLYQAFGYCPGEYGRPCIGAQRLPFGADAGVLGVTDFNYGQEQESMAVYLQGTFSVTDSLDITAGVRYTEDEKSAFIYNENNGPGTARASEEWDNVSYLANVTYHVSEDINVYAKYTTGYNAGGFNGRAASEASFQNPFNEEEVAVWELGLKSEWLDNRLRLNVALFSNDYTDVQVAQFEAGAGGASSNIVNAGEGTREGFEVELLARPTAGLTLNASYGYLDAEFDEYLQRNPATNQLENIADITQVGYSPENTWNAGIQYDFGEMAFGQLSIRADVSYFDEIVFHPYQNEYTPADDWTLVGARASLNDISLGDGNLRISIWGKNLTDEEYRVFGIDFGALGFSNAQFGTPRTYGIDFVYNLD